MGNKKSKAIVMRNAIDMIEGALMDCGDLTDLPELWQEVPEARRHEVKLMIHVTVAQVFRVCRALEECTRIINSAEFAPEKLR